MQGAIGQLSTGERVFAGPRDDPFFVDLGGIFDLGGVRNQFSGGATNPSAARDGVAGFNTHSIVMQIPVVDAPEVGTAGLGGGEHPRWQLRDRRLGVGKPPAGDDALGDG